MKKLIFLFLSLFAISISGFAQNANRKGFFIEAGVGGFVGNTRPYKGQYIDNGLLIKNSTGAGLEVSLGGRFRIARHWAYEGKFSYQGAFENLGSSIIVEFLPIGFRYYTGEIWRNNSLFLHANLGMSTGSEFYIEDNMFSSELFFALSYEFGIGVNLTTHLYVEAIYNSNLEMIYDYEREKLSNGGIIGVQVGYRF